MRADLHIHTSASDGAWSAEQVVSAASQGRLDVIAITDHDTTASVPAAVRAAGSLGLRVVPGVELSTTHQARDVHMLAYFVDVDARPLRLHESRARGRRQARIETMVARLRGLGVEVDLDAVLAGASAEGGVVGRPHLARALMDAGHVASISDAFDRYIGDGLPAFEPIALLTPEEGIALALAAGGIPVWAHPPPDLLDSLLPQMVRAGLRGLEIYRTSTRPDELRRLERVARTAGLLTTGGSDWHNPDRGVALGSFWVPGERVARLLEAGGF